MRYNFVFFIEAVREWLLYILLVINKRTSRLSTFRLINLAALFRLLLMLQNWASTINFYFYHTLILRIPIVRPFFHKKKKNLTAAHFSLLSITLMTPTIFFFFWWITPTIWLIKKSDNWLPTIHTCYYVMVFWILKKKKGSLGFWHNTDNKD